MDLYTVQPRVPLGAANGAFPPEGAGRFDAAWWSRKGTVRRCSVTACVSTTDSTLMVCVCVCGGGGATEPTCTLRWKRVISECFLTVSIGLKMLCDRFCDNWLDLVFSMVTILCSKFLFRLVGL